MRLLPDRLLQEHPPAHLQNTSYLPSLSDQFIIKNILLHNASHAMISPVRKTSAIMFVKNLPDMRIDRECIHVMQCKQTNAVCYFFAYSTELHQFFSCSAVILHLIQFSSETSPARMLRVVSTIYLARYPIPSLRSSSSVATDNCCGVGKE